MVLGVVEGTLVRHYVELCPNCGLVLPKGPAKRARHFAKDQDILANRQRRRRMRNGIREVTA